MRMLISPLAKKTIPLSLAIVAGAFVASLAFTFGAVDNNKCTSFVGTSKGNDPTQIVSMVLCRDGSDVVAIRHAEGDAGTTKFELSGAVVSDHHIRMTVDRVHTDTPSPGWVTCSDDIFDLYWDEDTRELTGFVVSTKCHDKAALHLTLADDALVY